MTLHMSSTAARTAALIFLCNVLLWLSSFQVAQASIPTKSGDEFFTSFYNILNLPPTASESEIKRAYRKLSLEKHPDRAKSEDVELAEARFQSINQAYQVLSNSKSRRLFDSYGLAYTSQIGYYEALEQRRVPELYKYTKGVHLIYEGNIEELFRNSPYTWIVSFYQAGCGSCSQRVPFITRLGEATVATPYIRLAMVNCALSHACQIFNVHHLGQILFIPPQQEPGEIFDKIPYDGPLSQEMIISAAEKVKSNKIEELESDRTVIERLREYNLQTSSQSRKVVGAWVVGYYKPTCPPCRELKSALRQMYSKLSKQIPISLINCDKHKCDVPYYPFLRLFVKSSDGIIRRHALDFDESRHPGASALSIIGFIFDSVLGLEMNTEANKASGSYTGNDEL